MASLSQNQILINFTSRTARIFALLAVYIIIIFGIFLLQFNNEVLVHRNIGTVQLSVREMKVKEDASSLKNSLSMTYKGITISANNNTPAVLILADGKTKPVFLQEWRQVDETRAEFQFSDGVFFFVQCSDAKNDMICTALLPYDAVALTFNYTLSKAYNPTGQGAGGTVFGSTTDIFILDAPLDDSHTLVFRSEDPVLSFRPVQPENTLSFDALVGLELASENVYRITRNALTERFIEACEGASILVDEQAVISYIAALGERNQLSRAMSHVSELFANSSARTYLSAPYFNSLARMNADMGAENEAFIIRLNEAISNRDTTLFAQDNLYDLLIRQPDKEKISAFLLLPTTNPEFSPDVRQSAGMVNLYSALLAANSEYAGLLEPVISKCLVKIAEAGSLNDGRLFLKDPDESILDVSQAVKTGAALLNYAAVKKLPNYQSAGRLIVNSVCSEQEATFDLQTLGDLYRILNQSGNHFYPHGVIVTDLPAGQLWAWTVAQNISYQTDALRRISFNITYPVGESHYLIVKGLPPFRSIEIHDMPYRSDQRFETYNASGYTYDMATQTLLIKIQQLSRQEIIRFTY
ncbi:MAG: hypothetical protein LBS64_01290 [Spirochaetaceae bacterium]|jgi:hypothetical protein|nr:hypothetical protein [Spirochaetaceae bacterium]